MSVFFHAVTHWSWVAHSLLHSISAPQEAGTFELIGLQIAHRLLQQLHLQNEKAEQVLHKEMQSACDCALSHNHGSQLANTPCRVLYQGARRRAVVTKAMLDYPLRFFSWLLRLILTRGVVLMWLLEVYSAAQPDSPSVYLCC